MGGKLDAETAYKNIKLELKELKRVRKSYKKRKDVQQVSGDETT
jgi:predicted phosphoribosyltransferase